MSRTAITLKRAGFQSKQATQLKKDHIDLPHLMIMSNEDKNISGFLVLDLRKWWRHVQTKNRKVLKLHVIGSTFRIVDFICI